MINALNMKLVVFVMVSEAHPTDRRVRLSQRFDGDLIEFRGTKKHHASKRLSSFQWRERGRGGGGRSQLPWRRRWVTPWTGCHHLGGHTQTNNHSQPHSHPQSTEHHLSSQSGQTFSCATWEPTRAEEEEARSRFKLTTLFLWGNDAQHCTTTLHIFRSTSCPVLWSSEITSPPIVCLFFSLSHPEHTHTQNIL